MPKDIKWGKDIKDYLHLYLGCECRCYSLSDSNGWIDRVTPELLIQIDDEDSGINGLCLILRPLSDLTEGEAKELCPHGEAPFLKYLNEKDEWYNNRIHFYTAYSECSRFLLSKGFDLFNLINEGLAIDATKIQKV